MTVELQAREIRRYMPLARFDTLTTQQRRWLAATILRSRPDANSQRTAFYLEIANPNFNSFAVVQ